MSNKNKDAMADIDFGLTLEISFDEFLRPQSARLQTDANDSPEAIRAAVEALATAGAGQQSTPPMTPKAASPLFSEAVADYSRMKRAQGKWTEKTQEDYEAVYRLFVRIVGDKPIAEIEDTAIVKYLETLQRLPANINKSPMYVGKTIEEIVALAAPPMAARSVNKNVERVSSIFK